MSVHGLIRSLLDSNPEANHTDAIVSVWEAQGLKLTDEQKQFMRNCVSPRTIISSLDRCRRKTN